jgi:hypothetical protein
MALVMWNRSSPHYARGIIADERAKARATRDQICSDGADENAVGQTDNYEGSYQCLEREVFLRLVGESLSQRISLR